MPLKKYTRSLIEKEEKMLSFEELFLRYYPLVYRLAYRCLGEHDEAEDIAQEVFLRLHRTPPRSTSEAGQRAWLCQVATHLSLNMLRTNQRRTQYEERAGVLGLSEALGEDPEQHILERELASLIRTVFSHLPERQQSYLLLRSMGLSYAEIAEATGVATASVGTLLARAEREFRRRYYEHIKSSRSK